MTAKLVLAGHSHVHALGVPGWPRDKPPGVVAVDHPAADILCVAGARDAAYWDAFVDAAAARVPAVIWTGNQHYSHFLFCPAPAFDFIRSEAPELRLDREAQIVPEEMLRAFFEPSLAPLVPLLERLKRASGFVPIVIGTPPPKGDLARLCANLDREPVLKDAAHKLGLPVTPASLTPVRVMVKLWRLLQTRLAEIASGAGATFVPVPQQLVVGEGVLADDHWGADATHANRIYGWAMLAAVVRTADQPFEVQ